jgi:hypothetical protein
MKALRTVGRALYRRADCQGAAEELKGKTEMEAVHRLSAGAGPGTQISAKESDMDMEINTLRSIGHGGQFL